VYSADVPKIFPGSFPFYFPFRLIARKPSSPLVDVSSLGTRRCKLDLPTFFSPSYLLFRALRVPYLIPRDSFFVTQQSSPLLELRSLFSPRLLKSSHAVTFPSRCYVQRSFGEFSCLRLPGCPLSPLIRRSRRVPDFRVTASS